MVADSFFQNYEDQKRFEYRRKIAEDFELVRLEESMWPEWGRWMQKLHQSSLYAGDRSLMEIEEEKWFQMYMRTSEWESLHYFWLLDIFEQNYVQSGHLQKIDEFDD